MGGVAPTGHVRFLAVSRDIFTPQWFLPQCAVVAAILSIAS